MNAAAARRFQRELKRDKELARWWYRFEFLEWLIDDDPRNLEDIEPDEIDEEVLARDGTSMARLVAPWLAAGLLARVGCYADERVSRNSRLPELLLARANAVLAQAPHRCDAWPGGCRGCSAASRSAAEAAELFALAAQVGTSVRTKAVAAQQVLPRAA
ncbi:hypothetical protein ACIQU4_27495 [Streptomyces sp. NPDC090741]|uniref:hypothetical protein n=1 Tax=Streptomyces sp. NPDC090741 TaxID=3365967 RepID=UPI0037F958E9